MGLLLDVSESMSIDLGQAQTAAIRFVNALEEARDTTLVDFDHDVRVARFEERDYPRLFERIRGRKAFGSTALYDAVGMYLRSTQDQEGQRVLLLYTDGGDNASALPLQELLQLVRASDVTVFTIGSVDTLGLPVKAQQMTILNRIAATSGGEA